MSESYRQTKAEEKILDMLIELFDYRPIDVTPTADFQADLGLYGIEIQEFCMFLEEEFEIELPGDFSLDLFPNAQQLATHLLSTYPNLTLDFSMNED